MTIGIDMDPVVESQDAFDLLKVTLRNYPNRGELTVLQKKHTYPVMNRWFRDDKRIIIAGTAIAEEIMIDENGSAKMVKPYATHEGNTRDVMARFQIPFRLAQADWAMDKTEILRNGKSEAGFIQLCKLIKIRRAPADLSLANLLERQGWNTPLSSADDENAHGIPFWLVPITSAQVAAGLGGDHIGQNPVGFSDTAGIDASQSKYELWRSYCDVWDNNTPTTTDDDVRKMTRMHRRLRFEVPMNARDWEQENFQEFEGYVSEARLESFEERARANNESLGADLGKFCGQVTVKGTPLRWVDTLDDVASDPMYLINHNHWNVFVMEGDNFAETTVAPSREQHRTNTTFIDLQFNFVTMNRRMAGGRIDYVV